MEREGLLQWFEKLNIDDYSVEQLLSFGIETVPAILTIHKNNKRELKEGPQAFAWLNDQITNRRLSMANRVDMNRKKIIERNRMVNNNGIVEFSNTEMKGTSDEYAYLSTDLAQPKSFVNASGAQAGILTYKEGDKVSDTEMKKRIEGAKDFRNKQSEQLKQGMMQGQLEAIYDNKMLR